MEPFLKNIYPTLFEDIKKLEGSSQKNAIYDNVFTFPQGMDHLKYFETNPHPDKIPDLMLAIHQAGPAQDLNVPYAQKILEFEDLRKKLEPRLSEKDRLLLRMPETIQKIIDASKDPDYKLAYTYLRDCFLTYLSTPLDVNVKPDLQWIDANFAMKLASAQKALEDLKNNLFNEAAKTKLVEKLQQAGAFGNERKDFYFWNTSPYNWPEISYQSRPVTDGDYLRDVYNCKNIPPQFIPLGNFTINAIPEGYVMPKGDGKYDIHVTGVYFFINDVFNFEKQEYLGGWDIFPQNESYLPLPNQIVAHLWNSDLREFQKYGYGRNFPIISKLQEIKNIKSEPIRYHLDE